MGIGWPQLLLIAIVILVLFGRGRISEMMGDFGKGIKSFKTGMAEEVDDKPAEPAPRISHDAKTSSETAKDKSSDSAN